LQKTFPVRRQSELQDVDVYHHQLLLQFFSDGVVSVYDLLTRKFLYDAPAMDAQEAAMLDIMEPSLPGMEPTPSELDNGMALDRECLSTYLKLVKSLQKVVASADMHDLHRNMFLHLLQKLANGETVSFSGEPLSGLQIMGVLETRALDFERLVLPSMNEGVVPAKPQQNTFIPNALRTAFGLPTQTYRDDVFAYHFFRLISRAKEVVFMYDCRTSGMQSGEQSRYLLQLQYLSDAKLEDVSPDMPIATEDVMPIEVQKSPRVMAKLKEFQPGGRRFISASNLKTYMACPLQFYLAYVEGLSTNDELEDEMDDSRFGNILHATLQQFYNRLRGQWVLDDVLKKALHDDSSLRSMIMDQYGQQDGLRAGYQQLICEMILSNVRSVLTFDRSLTPFQYLAAESQCRLSYRVNDGLSVNMKAVYDRLDRVKDRDGNECLRVVDYKTGNPLNRKASKLQVNGIDLAFEEGNGCSKEAFQVMFYCLMLKKLDARTLESLGLSASDMNTLRVQPHLYFTRELVQDKEKNVTVLHYKRGKEKKSDELETKAKESFEEQDMLDFSVFANDFERGLNHLLEELFDRNVPFKQAEEDHTCKYCKFRSLCGKIISNKDE